MSKVETIMRAVKAYGEACATLSRTTGDPMDARKHEQAVWCAIRDMLALEFDNGSKPPAGLTEREQFIWRLGFSAGSESA
jgi:hypothetical protein